MYLFIHFISAFSFRLCAKAENMTHVTLLMSNYTLSFLTKENCCGYKSYEDYYSYSSRGRYTPNSCCGKFDSTGESDQRGACDVVADINRGCGKKINKLFGSQYVSYVFNLTFYALYFVQILAIVLSLKLRRELAFKLAESSMPIHNQGDY